MENIETQDLEMLQQAQANVRQAKNNLVKATGASEFIQSMIAQRYKLSDKDSINLQTGEIVRAQPASGE